MKNKKMYMVYFKNGLHNPIKVQAENDAVATAEGLIQFRKDIYFVDFRSAEKVVDRVEEC